MPKKKTIPAALPDAMIYEKIYLIRNQKVMLDRDLADLYGVQATRLREQVKRNMDRFPKNFMFQLKENELRNMLSQNAIPSRKQLGGTLPYVFTEHGVLMLANVLKSEEAIKASIRIIEIFVKLRQAILDTTTMNVKIEHIRRRQDDQDKNMELVLTYIDELMEKQENPPPRKQIGYKRTDS